MTASTSQKDRNGKTKSERTEFRTRIKGPRYAQPLSSIETSMCELLGTSNGKSDLPHENGDDNAPV